MVGDLGEACIKVSLYFMTPVHKARLISKRVQVYTLEKVLLLQKDAQTGQSFLDEVMKILENKPSSTYWSTLARTLERSCREGSKCMFSPPRVCLNLDTLSVSLDF